MFLLSVLMTGTGIGLIITGLAEEVGFRITSVVVDTNAKRVFLYEVVGKKEINHDWNQ